MLIRNDAWLLSDVHVVPIYVARGRRNRDRRWKEECVQLAGHDPGAQILAGLNSAECCFAQLSRWRRLGCRCESCIRLLCHAKCRHLGGERFARKRQRFSVRRFPASCPFRRKTEQRLGGMGLCRECQGPESRGSSEILCVGPWLDAGGLDPESCRLVY